MSGGSDTVGRERFVLDINPLLILFIVFSMTLNQSLLNILNTIKPSEQKAFKTTESNFKESIKPLLKLVSFSKELFRGHYSAICDAPVLKSAYSIRDCFFLTDILFTPVQAL